MSTAVDLRQGSRFSSEMFSVQPVLEILVMKQIVIVSAKRTPFGRWGGKLARRSPVELAVHAAKGALEGLNASGIDQVIVGKDRKSVV